MLDNYFSMYYNAVTKGEVNMDFLYRLRILMKEHGDNNSTLAKGSGIPYTTIDGLFKRGWEKAQLSTIQKICEFYNVSLDWLTCNTEVRELSDTPIKDLRLDDETIEFLKTGQFNPRLLCEILKHPNFVHLINEIEIRNI